MSNIYLPSGYVNSHWIIEKSIENNYTLTTITGARGIGKTYGMLHYLYTCGIKFLYLRRTDVQRQIAATKETSVFNDLNEDFGFTIQPKSIGKYLDGFYETYVEVDEKGREHVVYGKEIAKVCALSTFCNIRGFSARDIEVILYDEFIPEQHEKRMKGEAEALFNLYESVSRNRELKGLPPVYLFCVSNANSINSPIYTYLGIMDRVCRLVEKPVNICESVFDDRDIRIIHLKDSPISKEKEDTALYRMTRGTRFNKMALENQYEMKGSSFIASKPINEYVPKILMEDIVLCFHKTNNSNYVTKHKYGSPISVKMDKKFLQKEFGWVWNDALRGLTFFDTYETFTKFCNYIDIPQRCLDLIK